MHDVPGPEIEQVGCVHTRAVEAGFEGTSVSTPPGLQKDLNFPSAPAAASPCWQSLPAWTQNAITFDSQGARSNAEKVTVLPLWLPVTPPLFTPQKLQPVGRTSVTTMPFTVVLPVFFTVSVISPC